MWMKRSAGFVVSIVTANAVSKSTPGTFTLTSPLKLPAIPAALIVKPALATFTRTRSFEVPPRPSWTFAASSRTT